MKKTVKGQRTAGFQARGRKIAQIAGGRGLWHLGSVALVTVSLVVLGSAPQKSGAQNWSHFQTYPALHILMMQVS